MSSVLTSAGFIVESCKLEYRPTDLPSGSAAGWVKLFGRQFLDKLLEEGALGEDGEDGVVREILDAVEGAGRRVEDGGFVLGYVRLRVRARKPEV